MGVESRIGFLSVSVTPPSLQLVKVGRWQGSTTDVAQLGWARLLIDRMDTQVQRPEFLQAPEPAWGSTKASAQDDKAMDAHHYHQPPSGFSAGCAR